MRSRPPQSNVEVEVKDVELPDIDEPVTLKIACEMQDEGIGAYEFWGSRGTDVRWCAVATSATLLDETEVDLDTVPESVIERAQQLAFEEAQEGPDDLPPDNEEFQ